MTAEALTEELKSLTSALNNGSVQVGNKEKLLKQMSAEKLKLKLKSQELGSQLKQLIDNIEEKKKKRSALLERKKEALNKAKNNIVKARGLLNLKEVLDSDASTLQTKEKEYSSLVLNLKRLQEWNAVLRSRKQELSVHNHSNALQELKDLYSQKSAEAKEVEKNNLLKERSLKEVEEKILDVLNKLKSKQARLQSERKISADKETNSSVVEIPVKVSHNRSASDSLRPQSYSTSVPSSLVHFTAKPFKPLNRSSEPEKVETSVKVTTKEKFKDEEFNEEEEEIFITDPPCQKITNELLNDTNAQRSESSFTNLNSVNVIASKHLKDQNNNPDNVSHAVENWDTKISNYPTKPVDSNENDDDDDDDRTNVTSSEEDDEEPPLIHARSQSNKLPTFSSIANNSDEGLDDIDFSHSRKKSKWQTKIMNIFVEKETESNPIQKIIPYKFVNGDGFYVDDEDEIYVPTKSTFMSNDVDKVSSDDHEEESSQDQPVSAPRSSPVWVTVPVRRHGSLSDLSFINSSTKVAARPKRWSHQMELMSGLRFNELHVIKNYQGLKGNLRKKGQNRGPASSSDRKVTFEPKTLLFSAAIEGELDIVKDVFQKISDINVTNEDGMTSLHHAIFAEHFKIVEYLVEEGCDVNAPDIDGWTPLHCAASCNDLKMCEFLIENGACIFSSTFDDQQLPSEKCDEMEEGFEETRNYLLRMQEEMGIANNGMVFALYDYIALCDDELSFNNGDCLLVLRKGDEQEKEWWWSCLEGKEGYVPRNLIGMHPRVMLNS